MNLYHCRLTFHDNLFYETRTMGRLYETGRLLHNIALCYALGLAETPYHHAEHVPRYAEELVVLNERGIYVTPASGLDIHYELHTFKYGHETTNPPSMSSSKMRNRNVPIYGRAKEIGVGSTFAFGVLSTQALDLPRWIRMGIWMSKARLETTAIPLRRVNASREQLVDVYPLNPGDLPDDAHVQVFDLVSMRPTNLLENALIEADAWWTGDLPRARRVWLPANMQHRVGDASS